VEGATQIDFDILPPDIRIAFRYRTEGPEGAVIVDDQVNRAKLDSEAIDKMHRDGDCCLVCTCDEGRRLIYLARRSR
jgi:hypothetical protein